MGDTKEEFDYPMKLAERDALDFQISNLNFKLGLLMKEWNEINSEIEDWEEEQRVLDI